MEVSVSDPSGTNAEGAAVRQTPWTVPNILTWIRIAAIPLVILAFYAPYHWANVASCVVFAAAGITDTLDGYLARNLGQITRLGAFLDPVADKLIVATALVLLVTRDTRPLVPVNLQGGHGPHSGRVRSHAGFDGGVHAGRMAGFAQLTG